MHTSIYMSIMQQNLIDNKEKQNERENVKHSFIHIVGDHFRGLLIL